MVQSDDAPGDTAAAAPGADAGARSPRSWRREQAHRLAPLLLTVLGGLWVWQASTLAFGEVTRPGPGMWPMINAVIFTAICAALVLVDRRADYEKWSKRSLQVLAMLGSLVVYVVLFQVLGFLLASTLMLAVWLRVFGRESWRWTLTLSVGGAVVFWIIFDRLLGVPFPAGVLLERIGG
ncbi:tripartite tricarboxylate transporter TctB family protein [Nocardioides sp. zg-1228]|uniref:tripartite tricarboxylate transporter TctB family protein n=1 Tax=Nocardioides sp. zg-1228 TaxID=2763008 RepID=UPI001642AD15|nr:tripartite tricarboxylate transporter TctB family protein [Nocardioides sp. zg-1228]MBC2932096.1 tripartite tricarboxylate transporter TctB family protein [Nocardioides sp. zg-1228]QSF57644.1 tripartite tricarboxylate transporter TctB family protein [Nocardioides sp. zg-1228]